MKSARASTGENLNESSGGGDPRVVAESWCSLIDHYLNPNNDNSVLDFGCGVGRLALAFMETYPELDYHGVNMVPQFINFAQDNITPINKNFTFSVSSSSNPLYTKYISERENKAEKTSEQVIKRYDYVFALSLFSHTSPSEASTILSTLSMHLHDSSKLFLTAFVLDEQSQAAIQSTETFPFALDTTKKHDDYLEDEYNGPRSAVAFPMSTLQKLFLKYDLVVTHQIAGYWRGANYEQRSSLQDILILEKRNTYQTILMRALT